jgi:hypothetical protein
MPTSNGTSTTLYSVSIVVALLLSNAPFDAEHFEVISRYHGPFLPMSNNEGAWP